METNSDPFNQRETEAKKSGGGTRTVFFDVPWMRTVFLTYQTIWFFDVPRFCDHHDLKPYY
jgi:hypothetical protein